MTQFIITDPSPQYESWRGQPCVVVDINTHGDAYSPEGYVDVRLTGKMNPGLRLRIRASAVTVAA